MKEKMNIYYLDKAYQDYIKPQTRNSQAAEKEESKRRTSGVCCLALAEQRTILCH